jgi:tetratricopeptide (TPR) repeat protein
MPVMSPFEKAVAAHRRGSLVEAEQGYCAALAASPGNIDALHMLGLLRQQQRRYDEAVSLLQRATASRPRDADLRLNFGLALKATGRISDAIQELQRALAIKPALTAALYNLGNAYSAAGRHEDAVEAFERTLEREPTDLFANNNLGNELMALSRYREAIDVFEHALQLSPGHPQIHNNLGSALCAQGDADLAIEQFRGAIKSEPRFFAAHVNLADALFSARSYAEAVLALESALTIDSRHTSVWIKLGIAMSAMGQFEAAISRFARALELDPLCADAWLNIGCTQLEVGAHATAIRSFSEALRISPQLGAAHLYRAIAKLTLGNFAEGLPEYEWRLQTGASPSSNAISRWHGEVVSESTLLITAEQGFGDTLQFIRFVPLATKRVAHVVLEVQAPLVSLIAPSAERWGITLITQGAQRPNFDFYCPLLSLPLALDTTTATIPSETPYISVPHEYRWKWRGIADRGKRLKIGLAWSGRLRQHDNRAVPISVLGPLLDLDDIDWIVLQQEISRHDEAWLNTEALESRFRQIDKRMDDFADTAAIMEQLDLIISIDTSIAHLAGAMSKPLWIMLPVGADWRWFTNTAESPWYPTARLIRQKVPGVWDDVVDAIALALRDL